MNCPSRELCLSAKAKIKTLRRHVWEDYKDEFYTFTHTDVGKKIYSRRKETVERSFADSKELFGLRYSAVGVTPGIPAHLVLRFILLPPEIYLFIIICCMAISMFQKVKKNFFRGL